MTDITRYRGDTVPDKLTITSKTTGLAVDITAFSFKLTVNAEEDPADNTNELYAVDGVITDGPNGKVEFSPSALQADQTPDIYYYDVQMTDGASKIHTIVKAKYTYSQDITKV